ncbi:substrate-binding domain-containing protein [Kushneria indalinina]|uniref:LacI family transcriptional regulator n=1 Tax=Kushneria indalinina DSM 14324 TaxID=1122140 RepID=A0A3D9DYU8_9GAMM|nr:substrate-binding domain-containing protein [Kushneria indalinina]REC95881.1 LacI family transcriptional regulator [Kushneria indalinina DSM 14324]
MTSIRELAMHLQISIGTVSRALNGKPDVNPVTRERVIAAAHELGYAPNQTGRALRRGATQTIGIMIETSSAVERNGDDFFLPVVDAAQTQLARHAYDLVILPCSSSDDVCSFLSRVVGRGIVDAIILADIRRQDPRIELLSKKGIPFLTLGRSGVSSNHAWIDLDFEGFVEHSLAELVALGHRRIAITLPQSDVNLGEMLYATYQSFLTRHQLSYDPALVMRVEQNENGGSQAVAALMALDDRPTALLLSYEAIAMGVYSELREAGLVVGQDLSVIGFRHNPQLRFLSPGLTAYEIPLAALGQALADGILAVLRGEPGPTLIWPGTLHATASIGPPPKP